MKKFLFIYLFILLSINSVLLANELSQQIDNVTEKEEDTLEADKNISNAKLYDIASSVAIKIKIPACVYYIGLQQEIRARN